MLLGKRHLPFALISNGVYRFNYFLVVNNPFQEMIHTTSLRLVACERFVQTTVQRQLKRPSLGQVEVLTLAVSVLVLSVGACYGEHANFLWVGTFHVAIGGIEVGQRNCRNERSPDIHFVGSSVLHLVVFHFRGLFVLNVKPCMRTDTSRL